MDWTNRVVVISGASAGVGRATSRAFAEQGASLMLLARGRAGLEGAATEARTHGAGRVLTQQVDIADADAVMRAAEQAEEELGPIDTWVNVAMTSVFAPVAEVTPEEFRRVMEVNYLGYVHGSLAALRFMQPRRRGTIVQVGSALAFRGIPLQAAYCASKHAVQGFHESLLAELMHGDSGIRASMVHLPALNTPQFGWVRTRLPNHPQPVPPIFQPEIAAEAIVHAAERGPRQLFVGGPTLLTKYGNVVAPRVVDWKLARDGFDDQQTDDPIDHERWQDNLFAPADEEHDHGAHGVFGDSARSASLQAWATMHKPAVATVIAGALAAAAAIWRRS